LCFRDSWLEKVSDKGDEKSQPADWSLEALRAVKTTAASKRWKGTKVRLASGAEVVLNELEDDDPEYLGWDIGNSFAWAAPSSPLEEDDIIAVLSPPPGAGQAAETYPGGFKVGDRAIHRMYRTTGTVIPRAEFIKKALRERGEDRDATVSVDSVLYLLDSPWHGACYWQDCSASLEHIKEEVTPPVVKDHSGNGFDGTILKAKVHDRSLSASEVAKAHEDMARAVDGADCIARDSKCHGAQDDIVKVLCLMCGRAVPAKHEKAHRQTMECIQARHKDEPAPKLDTWKCHCGAVGRYIDLERPFTDCPRCGGEVQDS